MYRLSIALLLVCSFLFTGCEPKEDKALIAFDVYCEMVANDAKPLALHYPMASDEIDRLLPQLEEVAAG